ncbi:MAG TPA: methyltransferase domain-containing protein, partial [Nannocystaceae bacterium]|nr:methyltransferase domain-containing protein [Nannocystaceae bacterium]
NLAFVLGQRGDGDETVLRALEVAMEIATRLGLRGREVGAAFEAAGRLLQRAERHDDAIAALESACDRDPGSGSAQASLGRVLVAVARYEDALARTRRAVELEPLVTEHLDLLALHLRRMGRNAEAAEIYAQWMKLDPDNPIPAHMHLALTGAPAPETANLDYVRREFDVFAERFDEVLRTRLEYRAPELVLQATHDALGAETRELDIADLGCGTGLCGPLLRPLARRLVGVDLSPEMLARAAGRGYDELVDGDLAGFCSAHPMEFDLLVAADVFVYIGALVPVLEAAHTSLRARGFFVFTIERSSGESENFHLTPGGRYAHAEPYARRCLDASGFDIVSATNAPLRTELRVPVLGTVFVARAR